MKFIGPLFAIASFVHGQIIADFETNIPIQNSNEFEKFSVLLAHEFAPLATANFMLLAGLEDEIWNGPVGDTLPAPHIPFTDFVNGRPYSRAGRLTLNVVFQGAVPGVPGDVDKYIVRQSQTIFAILGTTPSRNVYRSITGESSPVEIHYVEDENRFKVVINHDRDWLDQRIFSVRKTPMYRNIPITRIEQGQRFFSGSFGTGVTDGPGYLFPDEMVKPVISNGANPFRTDFNNGWTLAMDSFSRNANGSRFFITGAVNAQNINTRNEWNRRYTSFGTVLTTGGGRIIVNSILNAATDPSGIPKSQFSIRNIRFRRLGNTAAGFFPHFLLKNLPGEIREQQLTITRQNGEYFLNSSLTPGSIRTFLTSSNLLNAPLPFQTYTTPFNFLETQENITAVVQTSPRNFFRSYFAILPEWPARDFNFSGAQVTFSNVLDNGNVSGYVQLNFDTSDDPLQEGTSGTYTAQLPSRTVNLGAGQFQQYPAFFQTGSFEASLYDDEQPYRARIFITESTPKLDLNEFIINFDFDRTRLIEERISRFQAVDSEDFFNSIQGFWGKTN